MDGRYLTLAKFKAYVHSEIVIDDDLYSDAILAAQAALDNALRRRIELVAVDAVAMPRLFATDSFDVLWIDDCTEITAIDDNGTALLTGDWQAAPLNGLSDAGEPCPYDRVVRITGNWYGASSGYRYDGFSNYSGYVYPVGRQATVRVTAKWGWPLIPPQVLESCKIIAKDMLHNRDLSHGLVAVTDAGGVGSRDNRVVRETVARYRGWKSFNIGAA